MTNQVQTQAAQSEFFMGRPVDAKKLFLAAKNLGAVASVENCNQAFIELTRDGFDLETAPNAFAVLKALRQGILPSEEMCEKALEDIKPAANPPVH